MIVPPELRLIQPYSFGAIKSRTHPMAPIIDYLKKPDVGRGEQRQLAG